MSDLIVVVGGSASEKTKYAFRLAMAHPKGDPAVVICGDQYQLLDGWKIASGASDALAHRYIHKELYQSIPGGSKPPTRGEYLAFLPFVLRDIPRDATVIVDGMSAEYVAGLQGQKDFCGRRVHLVGIECPPVDEIKARMVKRVERMIMLGLVPEVVAATEKYGRDCWMAQNSFIVKNVLKVLDGGLGAASFSAMLDEAVKLAAHDKREALAKFSDIMWISWNPHWEREGEGISEEMAGVLKESLNL